MTTLEAYEPRGLIREPATAFTARRFFRRALKLTRVSNEKRELRKENMLNNDLKLFRKKSPNRLFGNSLPDEEIDIEDLRRRARFSNNLHGLVMWTPSSDGVCRVEVRFDLPTGEVVTASEFDNRRAKRARENELRYEIQRW